MGIKCFFLEPTHLYEYVLRRYTKWDDPAKKCPNQSYGHSASSGVLWKGPASDCPSVQDDKPVWGDVWSHDDSRYPAACSCGYVFTGEDNFQMCPERIYLRHDTKEETTRRKAPVGAMWFTDHLNDWYNGFDGHVLTVRLPGNHDWCPEQRASNCDMRCKHCGKPYNAHVNAKGERTERCDPTWTYNDGNPHFEDVTKHKCWVRHGTPPQEVVHVDKNGVTCGAGAGSIAIQPSGQNPGWHGFLHNGELVG